MSATKKVLLVTGGSRGIGAATSRLAAKAGYRVAVNYASNEAAATALVEAIAQAGGEAL
ncbi:MAG: SDR family NAD(P)-dependent oxidoreductase, partial [Mesorhizobium sp.]